MAGKITGALERAGIAGNTVVVFNSEHGDLVGDHGMLKVILPPHAPLPKGPDYNGFG